MYNASLPWISHAYVHYTTSLNIFKPKAVFKSFSKRYLSSRYGGKVQCFSSSTALLRLLWGCEQLLKCKVGRKIEKELLANYREGGRICYSVGLQKNWVKVISRCCLSKKSIRALVTLESGPRCWQYVDPVSIILSLNYRTVLACLLTPKYFIKSAACSKCPTNTTCHLEIVCQGQEWGMYSNETSIQY